MSALRFLRLYAYILILLKLTVDDLVNAARTLTPKKDVKEWTFGK
jgi:hypothetical protein